MRNLRVAGDVLVQEIAVETISLPAAHLPPEPPLGKHVRVWMPAHENRVHKRYCRLPWKESYAALVEFLRAISEPLKRDELRCTVVIAELGAREFLHNLFADLLMPIWPIVSVGNDQSEWSAWAVPK